MRLIIALCLFAVATAAPATNQKYDDGRYYKKYIDAQLLCYESDSKGTPCADVATPSRVSYRYAGEHSDGRSELKDERSENDALVIVGSYTWVGPDGVKYTLKYVLDENVYQPETEEEDEEPPGAGVDPSVLASLVG